MLAAALLGAALTLAGTSLAQKEPPTCQWSSDTAVATQHEQALQTLALTEVLHRLDALQEAVDRANIRLETVQKNTTRSLAHP
jgi:hypothetical protein